MRIKLDVALQLSRRQMWVGVAAALALVVGSATYAYSGPQVFTANEVLTAAALNGNFDDLNTRLTTVEGKASTVTTWVPYDAQMTSNTTPITTILDVNAPTAKGYWRRIGDTIEVRIAMVVPACNTAGKLYWTLPTGIAPDLTKVPTAYGAVGVGVLFRPNSTATAVTIIGPEPSGPNAIQVEAIASEATLAVACADLVANEHIRMSFSLPVSGWNVDN
jgi:hypothetical protein